MIAIDHAAMVADGVADDAHACVEVTQVMKKVPRDIPLEAAALLCTWREVYGASSDFQLLVHQWPTRTSEAARAMKATEEPGSIKTVLRF